jgi:eukaryotic-like serine/threonine-protein kinase
MLERLNSFAWIAPFVSCFIGYLGASLLFFNDTFQAPSLLGKNSAQAVHELSALHLNPRIVGYHEDADLPEGTIVDQTPSPGQRIRPGHHIFVSLSCKPQAHLTPKLIGISQTEAKQHAPTTKLKTFSLTSRLPKGTIISQLPHPDELLIDNLIQLYTSTGPETLVIVPSFKNFSLEEVTAFLHSQGYTYEIPHPNELHNGPCTCIINQQKPLAGSIISRETPPIFHMTINQPH